MPQDVARLLDREARRTGGGGRPWRRRGVFAARAGRGARRATGARSGSSASERARSSSSTAGPARRPRFSRPLVAGVVDEDRAAWPRPPRRRSAPGRRSAVADQAEIGLVHQRRGVEGVARVLRRHPRGGELPQLLINEREEFGRGTAVARGRGVEDPGHLGHDRRVYRVNRGKTTGRLPHLAVRPAGRTVTEIFRERVRAGHRPGAEAGPAPRPATDGVVEVRRRRAPQGRGSDSLRDRAAMAAPGASRSGRR